MEEGVPKMPQFELTDDKTPLSEKEYRQALFAQVRSLTGGDLGKAFVSIRTVLKKEKISDRARYRVLFDELDKRTRKELSPAQEQKH